MYMASIQSYRMSATETSRTVESGVPAEPSILQFSAVPESPSASLSAWSRERSTIITTLINAKNQVFHVPTKLRKNGFAHSFISKPARHESPLPREQIPLSNLGSQPLLTSPIPSAVPTQSPVLSEITEFVHQNGVLYISTTAPMRADAKIRWEVEFKPRLDSDLRRLNLNYLATDLFTAGRRHDQLEPTVTLLTTSLDEEKTIRRHLKSSRIYKDLANANIKLEILIDPNFGLKSLLSITNTNVLIEGRISEKAVHHPSGIPIRVAGDSTLTSAVATLGGFVVVNERLYGLTIGHAFAHKFRTDVTIEGFKDAHEGREHDALASTDYAISDGDSKIGSAHDVAVDPMEKSDKKSKAAQDIPQDTEVSNRDNQIYQRLGTIDAIAWADGRYKPKYGSFMSLRKSTVSELPNSDWALIAINRTFSALHKLMDQCFYNSTFIDGLEEENLAQDDSIESSIATVSHMDVTQVEVFGGRSGALTGTINKCTSSLIVDTQLFNVRQITLSKPLGK